jgi:hypothetical protein
MRNLDILKMEHKRSNLLIIFIFGLEFIHKH